jgi:hypothetical protein
MTDFDYSNTVFGDLTYLSDKRRERLRILHEEFCDFLESYTELATTWQPWVPVRMLAITGIIAYELMEVGLIELEEGQARIAAGWR